MIMMNAEFKVSGGKLIRVKFDIVKGYIQGIKFTGDFFLHPETSLQKLESALEGQPDDIDVLKRIIENFYKNSGCTLVGVKPESFSIVINIALKNVSRGK